MYTMPHHGKARTLRRKDGIPRTEVTFEAAPPAGPRIRGSVYMSHGVNADSEVDFVVEVCVRVGSSDALTREMCVGAVHEADGFRTRATPDEAVGLVREMLTDHDVAAAPQSFYDEVRKAAATACDSWRRTGMYNLARRMVTLGSHDEIVEIVDAETVRAVMEA